MPILVTGSSGFIGGILARDLRRDHDVRGFDVHVPASPVVATRIGSIGDVDALREAMDGIQAVVHLAANGDPDATWEDVLDANIIGTRNVFEAAVLAGVRRVVIASSSHASRLDTDAGRSASADRPPAAVNLYGVSKAFGETLGRQYAYARGLSVICLRIGWLNAEDDRARLPADVDATTGPMWISHRDLIQAFRCALTTSLDYGVFFAMSSAARGGWDLVDAERRLGYRPQD